MTGLPSRLWLLRTSKRRRPAKRSSTSSSSLRRTLVGNLDANSIALRLADVLDVPLENVRLVSAPLFHNIPPPTEWVHAVAPHLGPGVTDWQPDVALVGLGSVGPFNRLLHSGGYAQQIRNEINALQTEIWDSCPVAIAQICNKFFLVNPEAIPANLRDRAQDLADQLSSKSIAMPLDKLNRANERVLIAGGAAKAEAIKALLTGKVDIGFRPTWLVTDQGTARAVLIR